MHLLARKHFYFRNLTELISDFDLIDAETNFVSLRILVKLFIDF